MNQFVHCALGHFLMAPTEGEGDDLGGGDQAEQDEQEGDEQDNQQEGDGSGDDQQADDDEGDVTVTITGEKIVEHEEDQAAAPSWVKDLRKQHREAQRELRELRAQVNKPAPDKQAPVLGKKPTMDDDDIDYDADKFEEKLTAWHDRKREIDQAQHQQQQDAQKQQAEWDGRLAGYNTAKTTLKVKDFDDAEENVKNQLSITQQGIIIQGADNSALVVYALGKNPKKAAELAAITDPVKFAFAIAKLETLLKVQNKKTAPPPADKEVRGQGRITGAVDTTLERLRAEADKTGDMSKVMAYKRAQKAKA